MAGRDEENAKSSDQSDGAGEGNRAKQDKPSVPAWASAKVDQRILEAMVAGDARMLGDLTGRGISSEAILAYARDLGVGDRFIKDCQLSDSRPAMRVCMACESRFPSLGIHNRLCRRCRSR